MSESVPVEGVQTPDKWCRQFSVTVHGPDGWKRDGKSWDEPITEDEFWRRVSWSSCEMPAFRPAPADVSRTPDLPEDPRSLVSRFAAHVAGLEYPVLPLGEKRPSVSPITDDGRQVEIIGGYLVVPVDGCTCDGGGEFPHRPACGYEPAVPLAEVEAALARARRAEGHTVGGVSGVTDDMARKIVQAIADPGHFLKRGDDYTEPIPAWSGRAVVHVLNEWLEQREDAALLAVAEARSAADTGERHSLDDVAREFGVDLRPDSSVSPVTDDMVEAAAKELRSEYDSEFDAAHLSWQDFTGAARKVLSAALAGCTEVPTPPARGEAAASMARARQWLAHHGGERSGMPVPTWDSLTPGEQELAELEARHWIQAAVNAGVTIVPTGRKVVDLPAPKSSNERGATWIANKGDETEMGYTAFLHWSDNSPTVETDFAEWSTDQLRAQCLAGLAACDFADLLAAAQCPHDPDRIENDEVTADEHGRLCEPGSQVGDQHVR